MNYFLLLVTLTSVLLSNAQAATQCSKSSSAQTVVLLELYSSEGCSSCPPADELLRQLYPASGLNAEQVIGLALHVDYWDYLGWKDPFGKAMHTTRQNYLTALAGSHTIYTPEFFMGGKEFRPGRTDLRSAVLAMNQQPAQAKIHLALDPVQGNRLALQIAASARQAALLHTVLVEQGLSSQVRAGENGGSTLRHSSVVRQWGADQPLHANLASSLQQQFILPAGALPKNFSVVAFIENQQGEVLQALSLPLCN